MNQNQDVSYLRIRNLDNQHELAASLGNMVIAWSYAEQALMNVMGRVTGLSLNTLLNAYYRIPTINSRMQFLLGLLEGRETPNYDSNAISKEIKALVKLSATRNHWIHNEWCIGKQSGTIVQFDQRAKLNSSERRKAIKVADVSNHNEAVLKRCDELNRLIDMKNLII